MTDTFLTDFSSPPTIACFGSRETPAPILALMTELAGHLVARGAFLRSGHAQGADWAFEQGACRVQPQSFTVCLPWRTYNRRPPVNLPINPACPVKILADLPSSAKASYLRDAALYHGAWDRLTQGGQLLHGRNMLIAEGASHGICYLNHSKPGGGGSGQCYRVLTARGAEVLDLASPVGLARAQRLLADGR